jgi:hypothetical protein
MLRSGFTEEKAHQQLDLAINWGRYAELFSFEANTGQAVFIRGQHRPAETGPSSRRGRQGQTPA